MHRVDSRALQACSRLQPQRPDRSRKLLSIQTSLNRSRASRHGRVFLGGTSSARTSESRSSPGPCRPQRLDDRELQRWIDRTQVVDAAVDLRRARMPLAAPAPDLVVEGLKISLERKGG